MIESCGGFHGRRRRREEAEHRIVMILELNKPHLIRLVVSGEGNLEMGMIENGRAFHYRLLNWCFVKGRSDDGLKNFMVSWSSAPQIVSGCGILLHV